MTKEKTTNEQVQETQTKKPVYKKWWFWLIIIVLVIGIGGNLGNQSSQTDSTDGTADTQAEEQETTATTEETQTEEPSVTIGQKNALNKAKSYLEFSGFSYDGLVKQLKFEGFEDADVTYAVDNCGADWNEQAARKAQDTVWRPAHAR